MPLKALVLIFVSLPLSPFFGVRGQVFVAVGIVSPYDALITKKKFFLCLLSLFRFLQRRCKTTGYKADRDDRSEQQI